MVKIKTKVSNRNNYGGQRATSAIKYIALHYTANDGDSDEGNANYFASRIVKASAHYFVDDDSITQSVPDNYIAWSVGGAKYKYTNGGRLYGKAMNANTLNIELCDTIKNGVIYPSKKTIINALDLVAMLMKKYGIPKANVIRHYDVNGKPCPAYWTDDTVWKKEFWNKINTKSTETAQTATTSDSFKVKVTADALKIREAPTAKSALVSVVHKGEVYTIVKTNGSWGKLKSGAGWISLNYTKRI